MRVVFAGGGTGGHLYPGIALADALRTRATVLFLGAGDRLDTRIVPDAGYDLAVIAAAPLRRHAPLEVAKTAAVNAAGVVQALGHLSRFSPDVVIATGGYVCFPAMAAARLLRGVRRIRAPLALLEPNARPGLTNRLLTPLVDEIWTAFPTPGEYGRSKFVHTGIPVRASLLRPKNRVEACRTLGIDSGRRTILVVGGSQGARAINEAIAALVTRRELPSSWQILHISGERDYASMQAEERVPFGRNAIHLRPYLRDMADAYTVSDLVVARAGASTLGELAALGKPAILIPYPHAAEDHQTQNARTFAACGAAVLLPERDLNPDSLWWTLRTAMEDSQLEAAGRAAHALSANDPVAAILARIDALASRRGA